MKNIVELILSPSGNEINELRESKFKDGLVYPHCIGHKVIRFGKYKGRQRYKCNGYKKAFIDWNFLLFRYIQ